MRHPAGGTLHQLFRGRREEGPEGAFGARRHVENPARPTSRLEWLTAGGANSDSVAVLVAPDSWRGSGDQVAHAGHRHQRRDRAEGGDKVDNACGPMSHSAPRSCRHGDAPNGLSGS